MSGVVQFEPGLGRRVVGLDLSLTSTGMSDGFQHGAVQTSPEDGVLEERMEKILCSATGFCFGADLAVIEAGAFSRGAQSAAAEQLSALRFMVRHRLWSFGIPFAMVTPTGLKAYTTGYGKATKQQMAEAVRVRHGVDFSDVKVKDGRYDLVDAYALAAMGYAHLGHPLPSEGPPAPRASLNAVKWPQLDNDNPEGV